MTTAAYVKDFSKLKSCEIFSNEFLVEKLDWLNGNIKKNETKFRRASVCTINHGEENMLVRLGWKSSAAVKNKALERQFDGFLKNDEKGLKYEEISNQDGVQILYASGQEKFGFVTYLARIRYGNKQTAQVEIRTQSQDSEKLRKLVIGLVQKIDQ